MLYLRLLGQFELSAEGKRIVLHSRGAEALFAFLALTIGQMLRREHVMGVLWPDMPEAEARRHLRQELWHIRQALTAHGVPSDRVVVADEFTVGLNREGPLHIDTLEFVQEPAEPDSVVEVMTRASLYRGELLPGFYDDWILPLRERFAALYEATMCDLMARLVESGRWHQVIEWAESWISIARSPEPAFRALMSAYDGLHDSCKITESYRRCCAALAELGVEPCDETREMYRVLTASGGRSGVSEE